MDASLIELLFRKLNPDYQPRHEIYNKLLQKYLKEETVWLDIGCGRNEHVAKYGKQVKTAIGIDKLIDPEIIEAPFIQADLRNIPLPDNYADLITLRMVVEHIEKVPEDFFEINRLLKPGGILIFMTTNRMSPVVFIPNLFPDSLKKWFILKIFKVLDKDVFPTHHKFNSPKLVKKIIYDLRPITIEYIEDVPISRPLLLFVFGIWYSIVKYSALTYLRSNILAVFQKRVES